MKYYWIVVWCRPTGTSDGDDMGEIKSSPFNTQQEATQNLEARINQPSPDINLPKGAYIVSYSVEMKT